MQVKNTGEIKGRKNQEIKKQTKPDSMVSSTSTTFKWNINQSQKENKEPNKWETRNSWFKKLRSNLYSLDQKFFENPSFVSIYAREIFEFQKENQISQLLPMEWIRYSSLDSQIRLKSIEFFIQWSFVYNFSQETLFLAIYIFDLMTKRNFITKQNVSIVFICANHLASKYLETFYFPINDFINWVSIPVEKSEVILMEETILNQMNFNLGISTPFDYLQRITMITKPQFEEYVMMHQFTEIFFFDPNVMAYFPQQIAIAAYKNTVEAQKRTFNSKRLRKYIQWSNDHVQAIQNFVQQQFLLNSALIKGSLRKKYQTTEFTEKLRKEYCKLIQNVNGL